jgi:transposase-like protein
MNKKVYGHIEEWRNRPLKTSYPYVYFDGIYLKRCWGGSYDNVAILVALAVDEDGYREIIGCCEGGREDKESWLSFLRSLKERGLSGMKLSVGDRCLGFVEALGEVFPESKFQRCRRSLLPEHLLGDPAFQRQGSSRHVKGDSRAGRPGKRS